MDKARQLIVLVALTVWLGCEQSFAPRGINIDPAENDPMPYFNISCRRSHSNSTSGQIEGIHMTLCHRRKGELIDYGRVSFGGVELYKYSYPPDGDCYYNYLQSDLGDREFQPRFRFDQGNLTFKVVDSPVIEDIEMVLRVPSASYMTNLSLNMTIDPAQDWTIRMNKKVNGARYILQPYQPKPDSQPIEVWMLPPNNDVAVIPASTMQLLKSQSLGTIYLISYDHSDFEVDSIAVRAKGSRHSVIVPVHFYSADGIEFVM